MTYFLIGDPFINSNDDDIIITVFFLPSYLT